MLIRIPRAWEIPDRLATPEDVYLNRRRFLRAGAIGGAAAALGAMGIATGARGPLGSAPGASNALATTPQDAAVRRNPKYKLDRPITDEVAATNYNNFYEFNQEDKTAPARLVGNFKTSPWEIEITGLVEKKIKLDVTDLVKKMPLEERLYRFRCVEAWAMAVPWVGFPMKAFLDFAKPLSSAKFVRMFSFYKPDEAPGFRKYHWYPWPYFEGITLAEASNELTMLVTGMYGHDLPKQNGAPIRLITPWKYGYKSIKSVVKFEFTKSQPPTFWNTIAPTEYDFWSNVNPAKPHPRWSQEFERMIPTGERRRTLPYNGYGEFAAHLYEKR